MRGGWGFFFFFILCEGWLGWQLCILCCQLDGVIPFGCGDGDGTLATVLDMSRCAVCDALWCCDAAGVLFFCGMLFSRWHDFG
jgi:hypothetical protein